MIMNQTFDNKESREWLVGVLRENTVTVKFEKVNGELREMRCTLQASQLPESKTVEVTEEKSVMDITALRVFDVDKSAWRSFKWESIKEFSFSL